MLSYQHSFHAGNFADVHKHTILLDVVRYLQRKNSAITFYDTHAGRGWYDLDGVDANKTGEYLEGINRLNIDHNHPEAIERYLNLVRDITGGAGDSYPGSPMLVADQLRDQDELHLAEAHPGEFEQLRQLLKNIDPIHIHERDGFEMVKGLFPPPTPRGMILIDPSYEQKEEYQWVAKCVKGAYRRWQKAVCLIWYPLLPANNHLKMIDELSKPDLPPMIRSEISVRDPEGERGMYGSGMLIINPSYSLVQEGEEWLKSLAESLSDEGKSSFKIIGEERL
ncbi:23S rRNA (adenine(2030)-N(6))-methyltransferase RlmJ [Umboniibacter marinipuniceus]|uniref:Ribosomal RNA large subunit methyltransferase J n=1 Tax=Umboniibacter marinipuniceus TaxID=569599 RepID=A0A3M0A6E2_9GAMM|nr:23S rRNA (adenine(2030)-N(6))-methyltransferase RlmJ [Umboniibacter marinipuniceus]RMA80166.1 23S rRNA (adenine2030-N6)-methyltransferase [Umboniibacter marinipuniceus]